MIKRYRTRCATCGHSNTLRITLGTEARQEHTFDCTGCGEKSRIAVELDFLNRESYDIGLPESMTFPSAKFYPLENCEESDQEGTITNLDPNFLVPEKLLHVDQVFSWMYSAGRLLKEVPIPDNEPRERGKPVILDVINSLGIPRYLGDVASAFCKAWRMYLRKQSELERAQLDVISKFTGAQVTSVWDAALVLAAGMTGRNSDLYIKPIVEEIKNVKHLNREEFERYQSYFLLEANLHDAIGRQVETLNSYVRGIDQFNQTWVYVALDVMPDSKLTASSRDLDRVRLYYGEAFEHLASGLSWAACLNNMKAGRKFDQFERMTLNQYLVIHKARRHEPFAGNAAFRPLYDEFDSVVRNASHHGAIRLAQGSNTTIEYRSGDSGSWKRTPYADYLLKCNRIQICMMRLLVLQLCVLQDLAG